LPAIFFKFLPLKSKTMPLIHRHKTKKTKNTGAAAASSKLLPKTKQKEEFHAA